MKKVIGFRDKDNMIVVGEYTSILKIPSIFYDYTNFDSI